jgi:hypothetical protein
MNIGKALIFGGWPGLILLLAGNAAAVGFYAFYVFCGRYRKALCTTIITFPFTFYAGRAAGILAYEIPDFDQRVGLSTFLVCGLFLIMLLRGKLRRPTGSLSRSIEWLVWIFAISVTIGQFVTHDAWAATFLSIGAAWQFLALFYVLVAVVRRDADVFALLNSLFLFSLFNVLVRVIAKGEPLIVSLSSSSAGTSGTFGSDAGRVGSGALGPAVSYAGYLTILITLALGVFFVSRRRIYLVYCVAMFVELLNTFTRGGLFVLGLLGLLLWFKRTRKIAVKVTIAAAIVLAIAWPFVYRYATLRGFSFQVTNVSTFQLRVELTKMFLNDYHFSWWGNGILRQTIFQLTPWLSVPIHNAYLEILDVCGIVPTIAFSLISILALVAAFRVASLHRTRGARASLRIAPFAFIALLQWIIFANTTSTSVLAYYPYEGTAIFWILIALPSALDRARRAGIPVSRAVRPAMLHVAVDRRSPAMARDVIGEPIR